MKNLPLIYWINIGILVFLMGGLGYGAWYGYNYLEKLAKEIDALSLNLSSLEENMTSTAQKLQENISLTHNDLSSAIDNEKKNVGAIEELLGTYKQEVGDISGAVTTLEKLSKTDPELLQKYSKIFFLNEHYAPAQLTEIPDEYEYYETKYSKINSQVWPYLENMLETARVANLEIYVYSAFRSFDEQNALKEQYAIIYGTGTANQFSADQGYSEHQLGTTVDLITVDLGGVLTGFEETEAYQWLMENAYKFGFILSYPDDNGFYIFEPWHWRFVGVKLATDLHNGSKNFYDLDQREIDEYLVNLFE